MFRLSFLSLSGRVPIRRHRYRSTRRQIRTNFHAGGGESALAPLTFADTGQQERTDPVAPARRPAAARTKDAKRKNQDNEEVRGFRELLEHLGTLTRNTMRVAGTGVTFDLLATPTPTQRRVFELLGARVPKKLM
jgi:hypothetical protein